jgi:hypothetical protein
MRQQMSDRDLFGEVDSLISMQLTGNGLRKVGANRLIDVNLASLIQHHRDGSVIQLVNASDEEGCILDHSTTRGGHALGTDPPERAITALYRDNCLNNWPPVGEITK